MVHHQCRLSDRNHGARLREGSESAHQRVLAFSRDRSGCLAVYFDDALGSMLLFHRIFPSDQTGEAVHDDLRMQVGVQEFPDLFTFPACVGVAPALCASAGRRVDLVGSRRGARLAVACSLGIHATCFLVR